MGPSPILSFIHTVSIGIMLNFNGGNNGYGLLNVTCKQAFRTGPIVPFHLSSLKPPPPPQPKATTNSPCIPCQRSTAVMVTVYCCTVIKPVCILHGPHVAPVNNPFVTNCIESFIFQLRVFCNRWEAATSAAYVSKLLYVMRILFACIFLATKFNVYISIS